MIATMPRLIKPWSISTTARNPDRLRGFLGVLAPMDGKNWDASSQIDFQIRLVQARLYGAFNRQFYNGLSQANIYLLESMDPVSHRQAAAIFRQKHYEDAPMRGRNSFKPLQKFGFANIIGGKVRITETGKAFLAEDGDYGEIFLRALLKWQLPNPLDLRGFPSSHGYNIKPFVGTLRLIDEVDRLCRKKGMKEKGLSRREFEVFALTLIDYRDIGATAKKIVNLREEVLQISASKRHEFFEQRVKQMHRHFNLRHLRDYADNAMRYFRVTKYIRLRGWGDYIDTEPSRKYEIASLFKRDNAAPAIPAREYAAYLADLRLPELPGETTPELNQTITLLKKSIIAHGGKVSDVKVVANPKLMRDNLRKAQRDVIWREQQSELKDPQEIRRCANELRNLMRRRRGEQKPALSLEWLTARGLCALNDAIKILPNYLLGDDGYPTNYAPAGSADIECFYDDFVAICEVTLLSDSKQWIHEAQPVMRHMHEFQKKYGDMNAYCIFIAPQLHNDTINAFRGSMQYGYEEVMQKIVPLMLGQFCEILDFCADRQERKNPITRDEVKSLFDNVCRSVKIPQASDKWRTQMPQIIEQWKQS